MSGAIVIAGADVEIQGYQITAGDIGIDFSGSMTNRWKVTQTTIIADTGVSAASGAFLFLGGMNITAPTGINLSSVGDVAIWGVVCTGDLDTNNVGNLEVSHSDFKDVDLTSGTVSLQYTGVSNDVLLNAMVADIFNANLPYYGYIETSQSVLNFWGSGKTAFLFDIDSSVATLCLSNNTNTTGIATNSTLMYQTLPGDDGSYLTDITLSGRSVITTIGGDTVEITGDGGQQSAIVVGGFDNYTTNVSSLLGCPSGASITNSANGGGALCVGGNAPSGTISDSNSNSGLVAVGGKSGGYSHASTREPGLVVVGGYGSGGGASGDWYGGCVCVGGTNFASCNYTPMVAVLDCNSENTFESSMGMNRASLGVAGRFPTGSSLWGVGSNSLFVCGEPTAPQITLLGGLMRGEITLQRRNDNKYYSVAAGTNCLIVEAVEGFDRYASVSEIGMASGSRQLWFPTGRG